MKKNLVRLLIGAIVYIWSCTSQAQCRGHSRLDDTERAAFVAAAQGERAEIAVEVLAEEGCSQVMLVGLRGLGAEDRFVDEKVGYAWVLLPKEKVLEVPDLPGISEAWASTADLEYRVLDALPPPPAARKPAPVPPFTIPIPRIARELPPDGPYFPAEEAGLTELWKGHPLADGRGIKVALFDDGMDLFHPALRKALDVAEHEVPKVADILAVSRPGETAGWVQFGDPIKATNGKFEIAGREWTAPHDGTFRFGVFSTEIYFGIWISGFSRGEPPAHVALSVGVLWDEEANRVWVDTNGDGSFLDQKVLGDYGETHDLDYFGSTTGEYDNRLPFGVKVDRSHAAVYLSLGQGSHAAFVAGTLAANRMTGGLYDGTAPNAQLLDVRRSSLNSMLVDVVASLARHDVDLLNYSGIFSRFGPGGAVEEEFDRHVLDRATAVYDKPISCLCFSTNALSVDDYQSAEMLRRNRQTKPPYLETARASARPDLDGLMNELIAPSASLATQSRYTPVFKTDKDGRTVSTYEVGRPGSPAPDGYTIGANPSPTIPFGAGVMADLISEARRQHVRYSAARLVQAVLTGSRLIPRLPAAHQGYGLINAEGAWSQLEKMSRADDPAKPELTSFVIEQGDLAARQKIQGFWSDFPSPRGAHTVQLWVTRRGGYAGSRPYQLSLRGDDGTFRLLTRRVNLIQGKPVPVRLSLKVSPGQHLALLQLIDATVGAVMQEVPLTERTSVGEPIAPGVDQYRATIPPLSYDSASVYLDPKVQAARFVMRIPNAGLGRYSNRAMPGFVYNSEGPPKPYGHIVETKKAPGKPMDSAHHVGPMEEFESLIRNGSAEPWAASKPHVYSIYWSNGGGIEYATPYDDPIPDVPITGSLLIRKYAVTINSNGKRLVATNRLADVTGRIELYNADLETVRLEGSGNHAQATLNRSLPAHLTQWRIRLSADSSGKEIADAYVFHCGPKNSCEFVAQKTLIDGRVTFAVDDPQEGAWRVIVRARRMVARPISYHIDQAFLYPDVTNSEKDNSSYVDGEARSLALPTTDRALYAAFRIAGTPGNEAEKNGLRIAMTPLAANAP